MLKWLQKNWYIPLVGIGLIVVSSVVEPIRESILNVIAKISKNVPGWLKKVKTNWGPFVRDASIKYGVPESIIASVIILESNANPNATRKEKKGTSWGLMQMMDYLHLHKRPGWTTKDLLIPAKNIDLGTQLLKEFKKEVEKLLGKPVEWKVVIAAYNAGAPTVGKVVKYLGSTDVNYWITDAAVDKLKLDVRFYRKEFDPQLGRIAPRGFAYFTIPYLKNVFGRGGIYEEARKLFI